MTRTKTTIHMRNDLGELQRISQLVEAFGQAHRLPNRTIFELNLVLDEVLTNIVSYGYTDTDEHRILVRLSLTSQRPRQQIIVEVEDDGQPFDLTAASGPALDLPVDERPIGGLGIHLVRALTDQLAYRRQEGRNVLSLAKVLHDRPDGSEAALPTTEPRGAFMEISETKRSEAVIVSVSGRVDATTAPSLEQRLLGLIDGGERRVVVDCAQLDYISSAGLRALLMAVKRLNTAGGKMAIGSLKDEIREVFDIAGFSSILSVYPSPEEALANM